MSKAHRKHKWRQAHGADTWTQAHDAHAWQMCLNQLRTGTWALAHGHESRERYMVNALGHMGTVK